MLQDLEFEQVDFGPFPDDVSIQFVYFDGHIFVVLEVFAVLFSFLASV